MRDVTEGGEPGTAEPGQLGGLPAGRHAPWTSRLHQPPSAHLLGCSRVTLGQMVWTTASPPQRCGQQGWGLPGRVLGTEGAELQPWPPPLQARTLPIVMPHVSPDVAQGALRQSLPTETTGLQHRGDEGLLASVPRVSRPCQAPLPGTGWFCSYPQCHLQGSAGCHQLHAPWSSSLQLPVCPLTPASHPELQGLSDGASAGCHPARPSQPSANHASLKGEGDLQAIF